MTSKDLTAYSYISNNTDPATKPAFTQEPSDDEVAFKESMQKGFLTEHESIYFGSKRFDVSEIPVRYE